MNKPTLYLYYKPENAHTANTTTSILQDSPPNK